MAKRRKNRGGRPKGEEKGMTENGKEVTSKGGFPAIKRKRKHLNKVKNCLFFRRFWLCSVNMRQKEPNKRIK